MGWVNLAGRLDNEDRLLMNYRYVIVGILAVMLSVFSPYGGTRGMIPAAQAEVVSRIVVEGNQRIETDTVLSYMQVQPGEPYDATKIDESIKALFQTGLFQDVRMVRRGNELVVTVQENPMINRVNFEGNTEIKDDDLAKEVELRERMMFTRARVQNDAQRIVALYRRTGYYGVTVEPKIIRLPQNRVDLVFEIKEGDETTISRLEFVGNNSFSDSDLRGVVGSQEYSWWKFFNRNDTYDPDRVEFDKELLRRYYLRNGFADVRIVSADVTETPQGNQFVVTYTIEEGPRYSIADVAVNVGDVTLDEAELRKGIRTEVGQTFDATRVDKTVENLTLEAARQGFVFAKVNPNIQRNPGQSSLNISYDIVEGPRTYIERIDITGNFRTEDKVIRRELKLFEGDAYNRVLVDRARRRLTSLDYFEKIDFQETPGSAPDKIILTVAVTEKSTGSISFSIGYSSTEYVVGSVALQERNFLGRGYDLKLNTIASWYKQQIDFSFTDPYFMDLPISAGFDLFATQTNNQQYSNYSSWQAGGALRAGFRLDEYSSIFFKTGAIWRDVNNIDKSEAAPAIIESQGDSTKIINSVNYVWDNLDNPTNPTNGFRGQLSGEIASWPGTVDYVGAEAHGWYFFSFFDSAVVMKVEGNGGVLAGYAGDKVPVQDRFFMGGDSFRGFEPAGVGPMQRSNDGGTDSIGGLYYAIGTLETVFPLGIPEEWGVKGEVFTDFGTVFGSDDKSVAVGTGDCNYGAKKDCTVYDSTQLRLSVGAGIIWQSPFGPLKFEAAYPLLKSEYDKTEYFRFSVGTRF